ncbi:MAG: protein kinase [Planctomyces sp.]|nr:protein kinase [Planctomyces sp.]
MRTELDNSTTNILSVDPDCTGEMMLEPSGEMTRNIVPGTNEDSAVIAAGFPDLMPEYQVVRKIGEGGMGAVFLATSTVSGEYVAVKLLTSQGASKAETVKRFEKESRLLAQVNHRNIANLITAGSWNGHRCLIMEFIAGADLRSVLRLTGALPEQSAAQIMADVLAGVAEAHELGIVHRDIKPGNILLTSAQPSAEPSSDQSASELSHSVLKGEPVVSKVTDFGLARHVDQSGSMEMTKTGMLLGTPWYISPEQCTDKGTISPASDVYSLGATFFELLTGRPPFMVEDPVRLISAHCFETPPGVQSLVPEVSDRTAAMIARCLEKDPGRRFADARHMLDELQQILSGQLIQKDVCWLPDAKESSIVSAEWTWTLESDIERVWTAVSNTERVNSALGLPSVTYVTERDEHGTARQFGSFRLGFVNLRWEEHPFEWVEGQRFSILREFENGPFRWFLSLVELSQTASGGTLLKHRVRIAARGLPGKLLAWWELRIKGSKSLNQLYRRIDQVLSGRLRDSLLTDPFAAPQGLNSAGRSRLSTALQKLEATCGHSECLDLLFRFLAEAPSQELARIQPRQLAGRISVDENELTTVCLEACRVGVLELHWDILCPTCRTAAVVTNSLQQIRSHEHCTACNTSFGVDLSSSVELIFRIHPDIRQADLKTYCIGGPEHAPHVPAQLLVRPGETVEASLMLEPGKYVLRSPQLASTVRLEANAGGRIRRLDLTARDGMLQQNNISSGGERMNPSGSAVSLTGSTAIGVGRLTLTLRNGYEQTIRIRLERVISRRSAMTASEAVSLPAFRRIFPNETFGTTQLSSVASSVIIAVRVRNILEVFERFGDEGTATAIAEIVETCREEIRRSDGSIVRESDDRLAAVFRSSERACESAIRICENLNRRGDRFPEVAVAVHCGLMHANMDNGRMEVAGRSITLAQSMLESSSGELLFSADMLQDEHVRSMLQNSLEQTGSGRVAGGTEFSEYRLAGRSADSCPVTMIQQSVIDKESTV